MQTSREPSIIQAFGNAEVSEGSFSFQGVVNGDVHIDSESVIKLSAIICVTATTFFHLPTLTLPASSLGSHDVPPDILDGLPQAAFNATSKQYLPSCLPDTRRDVLGKIRAWVDGDGNARIYWLKGLAGTGKSTIALTVAREQSDRGQLGASFFFKRGGGDLASTQKFAATIAAQLAEVSSDLRRLISSALAANRRIQSLGVYEQWRRLILQPLSQLRNDSFSHPLLIVVDALDECDDDRHTREAEISVLVRCLEAATTLETVNIRVMATSRPDRLINLCFDGIPCEICQDFVLHDVEKSIIDDDLAVFYKKRLSEIAYRLGIDNCLSSDDNIKRLVKESDGLFIHAATICDFISDGGILAPKRLSHLLDSGNLSIGPERRLEKLDQLYTTVLEYSFRSRLETHESAREGELFHHIVGSIIVLFDVMTLPGLVMILEEAKEEIVPLLTYISSVVDVSKVNQPIRVHSSFREFLLDPARCLHQTFSIDAKEAHGYLFRCCLRIMKDHLRRNLCELSQPGERARDVSNLEINKYIPPAAQYASCYWSHHLQRSAIDPRDHPDLLDFFRHRFLYWLEVLALIGRLSEAVPMIQDLEGMLPVSGFHPGWQH